ncbi:hypothetical protein [Helicobacter mehlei]|uniref:Periplasmic protein n=1 Tax=Helicobacter mehlei TaxID=2316080 RepID=A0A553V2B3_9HELI|nr:hypothetical protein [Helicobacter mehlei]TSA86544.1 hypothetical protein FNE76_01020 [Helicobacter mehlei]
MLTHALKNLSRSAFLLVGLLGAQDFVISYALQVHNGIATHQSFGIARALKKYQGLRYRCEIPVDEPKLDSKQELFLLDILLKTYQNAVLDCLYKSEVRIESNGFNTQMQNQNYATLRITTPLNAYLEGGLLVLEVYEKERK